MTSLAIQRPSIKNKAGVVTNPRLWASSAGYEFWIDFGHADLINAMGSTNEGLDGHGWSFGTATHLEGSTGDFLSSADIDPSCFNCNATFVSIVGPRIFGTYDHALAAARFLGYQPTKLTVRWFASFPTVNTNDTGCSLAMAGAGQTLLIYSNGTNFLLSDNVPGTDLGAAVDTSWHTFDMAINATNTEWFIDGTSQGTLTTPTDLWPVAMQFQTGGGANRLKVAWCRLVYS